MAQKSIMWTTGATGDGLNPYTMSEVTTWLRQTFIPGQTNGGVVQGEGGGLAVTGSSSPVNVATGGAYVYGFPYWNDAVEQVAIPTPTANTRVDRIVLRADWAAQTVRIARIAGTEGAGPPPLVQNPGTIYDIPLANVSITTGGAITVTDQRVFCRFGSRVGTDNIEDGAVTSAKLAAGAAAPVGAVNQFAGSSAPAGWLLCDGTAVSRTTYAALFGVIGTTYGAGDGSTTFNLPNLKGRVPVGFDAAQAEFNALGKTGGEKTHTLVAAEIPTHSHSIGGSTGGQSASHTHTIDPPGTATSSDGAHTHSVTGWEYGPAGTEVTRGDHGASSALTIPAAGVHTHTLDIAPFASGAASGDHSHALPANTGNAGSDTAHQNLAPYITLQYIIKY